jgi:hypothetical protein
MELPEVVARFQDAHDRHDTDTAASAFATDSIVVDDGHEHRGPVEIARWLAGPSVAFDWTRTQVGVEAVDADTWLIHNHLEGDFPGGAVDLLYRFTLSGGQIIGLQITPRRD